MKMMLLDNNGRYHYCEVIPQFVTMEQVYRTNPMFMSIMERDSYNETNLWLKGEVIKAALSKYINIKYP